MDLVEGQDYFLYYLKFPNLANKGSVTPNDDGTFSVYVNTRYPSEMYPDIVKHELDHLNNDDLYKEDIDIAEIEDL